MQFQHCVACPSRQACSETVLPDGFKAPISSNGPDKPGMCWNAYANVLAYERQRAGHVVSINDPALAAHPVAQANAASWPTGKPSKAPSSPAKAPASAPGEGSVTERIFAACEAQWATLGGTKDRATLDKARKAAIPLLEAAGVNPNSARKGSSMWVAARQ